MHSLAETELLVQVMGYGVTPFDLRTTNADKSFDCYCYFVKPHARLNYLEDQLSYLLSRRDKAENRRVGYVVETISVEDPSIHELSLHLFQYEGIDKTRQLSLLIQMPVGTDALPSLARRYQSTLRFLYRKITVSIAIIRFRITENDSFEFIPCGLESAQAKMGVIFEGIRKFLDVDGKVEFVKEIGVSPTIDLSERMRQLFETGVFEDVDSNLVQHRYSNMLSEKLLEKFDKMQIQSPEDYQEIGDLLRRFFSVTRLFLQITKNLPYAHSLDHMIALKRCHEIDKRMYLLPDLISSEFISQVGIPSLFRLLGFKKSAALINYLQQELKNRERDVVRAESALDSSIDARKFLDMQPLEKIKHYPPNCRMANWLYALMMSLNLDSDQFSFCVYDSQALDADLFLREQLQYILRDKKAAKNRRLIFFLAMPPESPFVSASLSGEVRAEQFVAVFVDCEGVNKEQLKWLLASLGKVSEINTQMITDNLNELRTLYKKVSVKFISASVQTSTEGSSISFPNPDLILKQAAYLAPFIRSSYELVNFDYQQPPTQPCLSPYILLFESMCQLLATASFVPIDIESIQSKYSFLLAKNLARRICYLDSSPFYSLQKTCLALYKLTFQCRFVSQFIQQNEGASRATYDGIKRHIKDIPCNLFRACQTFPIDFLITALLCQTADEMLSYFKRQQETLSRYLETMEERIPMDKPQAMTFGGRR